MKKFFRARKLLPSNASLLSVGYHIMVASASKNGHKLNENFNVLRTEAHPLAGGGGGIYSQSIFDLSTFLSKSSYTKCTYRKR